VVSGRVYLDASAAVKLILREPESEALTQYLARQRTVLSSRVLGVEVLRAVRRLDGTLEDQAHAVLAVTASVELDADIAAAAGAADPPTLRSLDAIHLASALSIGPELDAFVTYDIRQADAARALGLVVESPA
jgi:predicted nucleic acid-binding protein